MNRELQVSDDRYEYFYELLYTCTFAPGGLDCSRHIVVVDQIEAHLDLPCEYGLTGRASKHILSTT